MATYYVNSSTGSDTYDGTSATFTSGTTGPWATLSHAGATVAAGDTINIAAIAGNASSYPTSGFDYTISSFFTPTAGSTTAGYVRWIGTGGIPTIGTPGLAIYNSTYQSFENLYFCPTAAGNSSFGILNGSSLRAKNCTFNVNGQAMVGLHGTTVDLIGCEIRGGSSTSPTYSAGSYGVQLDGSANASLILGCKIHHCRDHGIYDSSVGTQILGSTIYGNAADGYNGTTVGSNMPCLIAHCTIDGNSGNGVSQTATAGAVQLRVVNSLITNHTGAGKYGISFTDGTMALNDQRKRQCDYNDYYNNTANYTPNVSAGSHDLGINPTYTSPSTGDYTPLNSAARAGLP